MKETSPVSQLGNFVDRPWGVSEIGGTFDRNRVLERCACLLESPDSHVLGPRPLQLAPVDCQDRLPEARVKPRAIRSWRSHPN